MQKGFHGQQTQTANESLTRRQRMFAYFHRKREWVQLNKAYVVAATTNIVVGLATAHVAQRMGASKENAASWIPHIVGFGAGVFALCAAWYFLHIEKYQKDVSKISRDVWSMLKNVAKAQVIVSAIVVPSSWFLASEGVGISWVVGFQQAADKILYWGLFNIFSRHFVRKMQSENIEKS